MLRASLLILALFALTTGSCRGAQLQELWAASTGIAQPQAAFFDASSGLIFLSMQEGTTARLSSLSTQGKIESAVVAEIPGRAGAMRAFDGRIYWVVDGKILSFAKKARKSEAVVPEQYGNPVDLAIARNGEIFVGTAKGFLLRFSKGKLEELSRGQPITGLLLLQSSLYVVRGQAAEMISLESDGTAKAAVSLQEFKCKNLCYGLERGARESWLSIAADELIEFRSKKSQRYPLPVKQAGRFTFVYRLEAEEGFLVIPFPELQQVKAYRISDVK